MISPSGIVDAEAGADDEINMRGPADEDAAACPNTMGAVIAITAATRLMIRPVCTLFSLAPNCFK